MREKLFTLDELITLSVRDFEGNNGEDQWTKKEDL